MKHKIVNIVLICIFVILLGIVAYKFMLGETDRRWFSEKSPNGRFTVSAKYESSSLFPPPTNVLVSLHDSNVPAIVCQYHIEINGTEPLGEEDYDIEWNEDHVRIKTEGNNGKKNVVRIYWEE
jgi:hypothetical protein